MADTADRSLRRPCSTSSNGRSLIRPATGSASSAITLPSHRRHEAALDLDQPVDRRGHVGIVAADDADIVAVVADRRGDGAAPDAEAVDEAVPDIAMAAVPAQHRHLEDVVRTSATTPPRAKARRSPAGRSGCCPGRTPITGGDAPGAAGHVEGRRPSPAAASPNRARPAPRRAASGSGPASPARRGRSRSGPCSVARSSSSTMSARWPGATRPRSNRPKWRAADQRGGAIGVERRRAAADGGTDQVVDVAFLGDVERVAVVGAEAPGTATCSVVSSSASAARSLRHRAFADQDLHALGELLARLGEPTSSRGGCARRRRCRH